MSNFSKNLKVPAYTAQEVHFVGGRYLVAGKPPYENTVRVTAIGRETQAVFALPVGVTLANGQEVYQLMTYEP